MSDIPTLPPKVETATKTGVMTKVTVALVAGLVLAAAAAGVAVLQLTQQNDAALSGRALQSARASLLTDEEGPVGARYTFVPNVDLSPQDEIVITLPSGVVAGRVNVALSSNVDGVINASVNTRKIRISRSQGRNTVEADSESVTVTLHNISFGNASPSQSQIVIEGPSAAAVAALEDESIGEERPSNDGSESETESETESGAEVDVNGITALEILAPSGEEILMAGERYTVMWSTEGDAGQEVRLSYTYDGSYWEVLADGVPSLVGRWSWDIPADVDTRLARVRVEGRGADGSTVRGVSNPLTVVQGDGSETDQEVSESASDGSVAEDGSLLGETGDDIYLRFVNPIGNTVLKAGESVTIRWELSAPDADRVHIYLTRDGENYEIVAANIPAEIGSYTWRVPNENIERGGLRIATTIYGGRRMLEDYTTASFAVEGASDLSESESVAEDGSTTTGSESESESTGGGTVVSGGGGGTVVSGGGGNGGRYGGGFQAAPATNLGPGRLLKIQCPPVVTSVNDPCRAVYYVTGDGLRHAFPNSKVYFSWFSDFSEVEEISAAEMQSYRIGSNVTYRPGYVMVKFQTLNTVYAVSANGILRPIMTEVVARDLYGDEWNRRVHDISDAFYGNYTFGAPVVDASQYDPSGALASVEGLWQNF